MEKEKGGSQPTRAVAASNSASASPCRTQALDAYFIFTRRRKTRNVSPADTPPALLSAVRTQLSFSLYFHLTRFVRPLGRYIHNVERSIYCIDSVWCGPYMRLRMRFLRLREHAHTWTLRWPPHLTLTPQTARSQDKTMHLPPPCCSLLYSSDWLHSRLGTHRACQSRTGRYKRQQLHSEARVHFMGSIQCAPVGSRFYSGSTPGALLSGLSERGGDSIQRSQHPHLNPIWRGISGSGDWSADCAVTCAGGKLPSPPPPVAEQRRRQG